jgi:hypothetical protein
MRGEQGNLDEGRSIFLQQNLGYANYYRRTLWIYNYGR